MTLPTALEPYSVWVLTHRNALIVGLGVVLFLITCYALVSHWRVQRLERDLAHPAERPERAVYSPSRSAAPAQPELDQQQPGGLPPVRGGRGYAKGLGTALQKSGVPPLYSPPPPAGIWAPNQPAQPVGRPPAPQFAPGPAQWGGSVPPQPQPMVWPPAPPGGMNQPPQFPGQGNQPGQAPPPWPGFQPSQLPQPAPNYGGQPFAPPPAQPLPPQFGIPTAPSMPAFAQAMPAPAPVQSPGQIGAPQAPAPYPTYQQPAPEAPPVEEPSKRGKPKRRRFSLSVLEGIEKKIQSLPRSGGAAAEAAAPPAAPAPPPPALPLPQPPVQAAVQPAAVQPAAVQPAVALPAAAPQVEAEAPPEAEIVEAEITVAPEPPVPAEVPAAATSQLEVAETPAPPEPVTPARSASRERASAMRSMMFGEEPAAAEPEAEAPVESSVSQETVAPAEQESEPVGAPAVEAGSASEPSPRYGFDRGHSESEPTAEAPTSSYEYAVDATEVAAPSVTTEPEPITLEAPYAPTADADAQGPSAGDDEQKPSAGTIVIIEDDPAVAEYYATLFRGNGYRVEVSNDGVSGVDLCIKVQPEVIMLDVMMPRQNGILVLQTLRATEETKNTPVVVLSNFSEPTLIKRALQLGALEYVIKTQVEGSALLQAVPRWMSREKAFAA